MRKKLIASVIALIPLAIAGVGLAGSGGNGNGFPSGPHYNLNVIGGSCKNSPMTGTNQHTIFVPLGSKTSGTTSNIYLCQGPTFQVLDGNACDAAIGCGLSGKTGAVFQLPCDLIAPNGTISSCSLSSDSASYCVYGEALGKPGGSATVTTCATDPITGDTICSTGAPAMLVRNTGKPKVSNVTDALTTLTCSSTTCPNECGTTSCTFEIFSGTFQDFFWSYDNSGLKNAQFRFYLEPSPTTNCNL